MNMSTYEHSPEEVFATLSFFQSTLGPGSVLFTGGNCGRSHFGIVGTSYVIVLTDEAIVLETNDDVRLEAIPRRFADRKSPAIRPIAHVLEDFLDRPHCKKMARAYHAFRKANPLRESARYVPLATQREVAVVT